MKKSINCQNTIIIITTIINPESYDQKVFTTQKKVCGY